MHACMHACHTTPKPYYMSKDAYCMSKESYIKKGVRAVLITQNIRANICI